jgi:hypothetical protein
MDERRTPRLCVRSLVPLRALVLIIAVAEEWITAPADQVESFNLLLLPLTAVFLAAAIFTAARARFRRDP